ncbi:hypothetical protein N7509_011477, partial [Penicillium cosmopolitanum]
ANPNNALKAAGKTEFIQFLRWRLKVRRGKNGRQAKGSIQRIILRAGLDTKEKEKTPMYIEDLRIQQYLYNLIACFTVNRINAIQNLQYKHILCLIQRNPKGGPPRILLKFTYKFTKKYLKIT